MKGTAAPDAPDAVLTEDAKSRAENLMIVDLLRNDLARVAEPGSVAVPELFAIERYPTVTQMVSRVTATLRPGLDAVDVLRTIFPCGSVTGAPKVAAMKALRALEPVPARRLLRVGRVDRARRRCGVQRADPDARDGLKSCGGDARASVPGLWSTP